MFKVGNIVIYTYGINDTWKKNKYKFKVKSINGLGTILVEALQDTYGPKWSQGQELVLAAHRFILDVIRIDPRPEWY